MTTDHTHNNESQNHSKTETDYPDHPFDRLMFGHRERSHSPVETEQKEDNNILNQINLEEVMTHIDTLMGTAQQLKPMFTKIRPLVEQFFKK